MNPRPSGYEPDELPGCSTPRQKAKTSAGAPRVNPNGAIMARDVDLLAQDVDALRAELKAVTSDPVRLERMAREEWGMVRGEKELLYRMRTDTSRAP